jgi:HK97 family phage portal protein
MPAMPNSNMTVELRAMGTVGTLFAIVNKTSNGTSMPEWHLYRRQAGKPREEWPEVTSHWALDLWNNPNPFYTRQELIEVGQQHNDLTGEAWLVINRRGGLPVGIWPVRPDRMEVIPDANDFIRGYIYRGPEGELVPLAVEDVIQIRMPDPLSPYRGMGPVQAVLTDVDSARLAAEWNRNFFYNSAEPGGIVEVSKKLSDGDFRRLVSRWAEQHKGVAQAHRVAILEEGKWVDRKYTNRDMQFTELRSLSGEMIREAFGFPTPLLGTVTDVNRANAEAAEVVFAQWLLVPRLERWKQALNHDYLPMFGPGARDLYFDYESPVKEDQEAADRKRTSQATAVSLLLPLGLDSTAVLEWAGMPDMAYNPPAVPATKPNQPGTPAIEPAPDTQPDDAPGAPDEAPNTQDPEAQRNRARQLRAAADPDLSGLLLDLNVELDRLLNQLGPEEERAAGDLESTVRDLVNSRKPDQLGDLDVSADIVADMAETIRGGLGRLALTSAYRMAQECAGQGVQVEVPALDPEIQAALSRRVVMFGGELVDIATAVANMIAGQIAGSASTEAVRVYLPGVTGSEIGQRVRSHLAKLSDNFARTQLGGALHRAINTGRFAVAKVAMRVKTGGQLTATEQNDTRTCEPCRQIDGQVFADMAAAQAAYGTGSYLDCLGGVRCRGTFRLVWPAGTEDGLTLPPVRGVRPEPAALSWRDIAEAARGALADAVVASAGRPTV